MELADRSASTTSGRSSTTSSRNTRTPRRPRCSSPPARSARKRIRLGHGIVLMPPQLQPPGARGRAHRHARPGLERPRRVGHGRSRPPRSSWAASASTRDEKRAMWREATEQAANMLAMTPYPGFKGKYFAMPCRNIVPKPVQQPHPPLWVACSRRETIHRAARARHGRADLRLRRARAGGELGRGVLRHHQVRRVRADRPHGQPEHRHGQRHVAATRDERGGDPRAASTASASSATRSAITASSASTSPGARNIWEQFLEVKDSLPDNAGRGGIGTPGPGARPPAGATRRSASTR